MLTDPERAQLRTYYTLQERRELISWLVFLNRRPVLKHEPTYTYTLRDWNILAELDPIDAEAFSSMATDIYNLPEAEK